VTDPRSDAARAPFAVRLLELASHAHELAERKPHFVRYFQMITYEVLPQLFEPAEYPRVRESGAWREFEQRYRALAASGSLGRRRQSDPHKQVSYRIPPLLKQRLEAESAQLRISENELAIFKLSQPIPDQWETGGDGSAPLTSPPPRMGREAGG